jgi:hypothetical protein
MFFDQKMSNHCERKNLGSSYDRKKTYGQQLFLLKSKEGEREEGKKRESVIDAIPFLA